MVVEAGSTLLAARAGLLAGRYELRELLGTGGPSQSQVARAWDHRHGRNVVLKLRPAGTESARQAQLAETRILLGLRPHPGLPAVREDFFEGDRYVTV